MASLSTLCYIERGDEILMLHRTVKENDVNKDKWIGVGGHFEENESPEECVLREVKEETGYTLLSYRYRGEVTFVSGKGVTEYMSLFTADQFTGNPIPCDEGELAWVKKEDIFNLDLWEGDKIFFRLLWERDDFFSLKLTYDEEDHLTNAALNGRPMELFDILDPSGNPTGLKTERGVAHREGAWHATAHIWIVRPGENGGYDVLLQKRSEEKDSNPGGYDISSAGHVMSGDTPLASAVREMREELGLQVSPEELTFVGMHKGSYEAVFHDRPFKDREYASVYLYTKPVDISELSLQKEEVSEVMWLDDLACGKIVKDRSIPNCIYPDEFDMVAKFLQENTYFS